MMEPPVSPEDVLLVDKPVGMSSFDVIRVLRKQFGIKKMGHAGTLDPLASGLMIIGVGKGTKLLHEHTKLDKVYVAEVCLGERTTTGDREGVVLEQRAVHGPFTSQVLEDVVASMVGTLCLPVPIFSAVKQGGEALYKKARRGEQVDVPVRRMEVFAGSILEPPTYRDERAFLNVEWHVASGVTYARSQKNSADASATQPGSKTYAEHR